MAQTFRIPTASFPEVVALRSGVLAKVSSSDKPVLSAPPRKKRAYSRPSARKLTLGQAELFVVSRANCSDQKASDWLESLRQELHRNEKWREMSPWGEMR